MSSLSKRMSISSTRSGRSGRSESPLTRFQLAPTTDSEDWVRAWQATTARDLIDSPIEEVDADTSVEDACDLLLSRDIPCLAVKSKTPEDPHSPSSYLPYSGLFDFADVNAFLTLAATRHTFSPEHLRENPRIAKIVEAAKAGHVPVHLVSNLSEKNPLAEVEHDASVIALLGIFSSGKHRVLIKSPTRELGGSRYLGMVSDRSLLAYFSNFAHQASSPSSPRPTSPSLLSTSPSLLSTSPSLLSTSPSLSSTSPLSPLPSSASSFLRYLSNPLSSLPLPSLNLYWEVVAVKASDSVLDAMRRMSELGVSSVAVVEEESGTLLSAVSVTDIGQIVVPSQSNQILSAPLHKLVASIKLPQGSNDGADRYPVYSVFPSSTLAFTMQKLLATNAHRVFVTAEPPGSASPSAAGGLLKTNLTGIVSIVDILSLFARVANLPNVDPTRMQRHRRASSASSGHSGSFGDLARSASRGSISGMNMPAPRVPRE